MVHYFFVIVFSTSLQRRTQASSGWLHVDPGSPLEFSFSSKMFKHSDLAKLQSLISIASTLYLLCIYASSTSRNLKWLDLIDKLIVLVFPPASPAAKPPLAIAFSVPGLRCLRLHLAAPRIRAGCWRLGHPPPTHRQPSHDRHGLSADGGHPAPCPAGASGCMPGGEAVQAFQRLLGTARRAQRVVQRDHPDHVGCGGVSVLHGVEEVPEPACFSPPVAELLLQEETEEL